MAKELFERIDRQIKDLLTEYALLRLDIVSKSDKLPEENLAKHGFLCSPQGQGRRDIKKRARLTASPLTKILYRSVIQLSDAHA